MLSEDDPRMGTPISLSGLGGGASVTNVVYVIGKSAAGAWPMLPRARANANRQPWRQPFGVVQRPHRPDVAFGEQAVITAPRDGMILRTANADTSTYIKEGDVLVTFAPQSVSRAVEIYVSGLDAVLVRPGRQVRLMFEGWPAVQFSGWPSVAVGTFAGVVQYVDPAVSINGRYRIVVVEPPGEPWPGDHYLRLGGKVRGWVLLNEVRLGYEIWRQLNYFPPEPTPAVVRFLTKDTEQVHVALGGPGIARDEQLLAERPWRRHHGPTAERHWLRHASIVTEAGDILLDPNPAVTTLRCAMRHSPLRFSCRST